MKVNYKQFLEIVSNIKYATLSKENDEKELEIVVHEEDVQNSRLGSYVSFTVSYEDAPSTYDDIKTPKAVQRTVYLFSESENKSPKIFYSETRDFSEG